MDYVCPLVKLFCSWYGSRGVAYGSFGWSGSPFGFDGRDCLLPVGCHDHRHIGRRVPRIPYHHRPYHHFQQAQADVDSEHHHFLPFGCAGQHDHCYCDVCFASQADCRQAGTLALCRYGHPCCQCRWCLVAHWRCDHHHAVDWWTSDHGQHHRQDAPCFAGVHGGTCHHLGLLAQG